MTCEFADRTGRKFTSVVTLKTVIALKKELGVDINEFLSGKLLERLAGDVEFMVNVLWITVAESAKAQEVTEEQFGHGLNGDALEAGLQALLNAMVAYFPQSQRPTLERLLEKGRELERLAGEHTLAMVQQLDPQALLRQLLPRQVPPVPLSSESAGETAAPQPVAAGA